MRLVELAEDFLVYVVGANSLSIYKIYSLVIFRLCMAPCGCLGFLTLWRSLDTWMFTCQMDSPQRVFPETGREN